MALTPQEIEYKRFEHQVVKFSEIIDKKLIESTTNSFTFNPDTSEDVIEAVVANYRKAGWKVDRKTNHNNSQRIDLSEYSENFTFLKELFQDEERLKQLSSAFVEPIKLSLNYTAPAYKILMLDELSRGKPPYSSYIQDGKSLIYGENGITLFDVNIPLAFKKLKATTEINLLAASRYYVIDSAQNSLKQSLQEQLNEMLISLLVASERYENTIHTYPATIEEALKDAILSFEHRPTICQNIIMSPATQQILEINEAKLKNKNIKLCSLESGDRSKIYLTPEVGYTGAVIVKDDIEIKFEPHETNSNIIIAQATMSILGVICDPNVVETIKVRM